MADVNNFEEGRKNLLDYLNGLVKSNYAALIEEKDEPYCESHETYTHHWIYNIKKWGLNVLISTGPLHYSRDFNDYDGFSLMIHHSAKKIPTKLIGDIERIINSACAGASKNA